MLSITEMRSQTGSQLNFINKLVQMSGMFKGVCVPKSPYT